MRSEQWIRTQKRRVRKKYLKVGNMYFSPREIRKIKNGMFLKSLIKALNDFEKRFQEFMALISEMAKTISEARKGADSTIICPNCGIEQYNDKEYCMDCGAKLEESE